MIPCAPPSLLPCLFSLLKSLHRLIFHSSKFSICSTATTYRFLPSPYTLFVFVFYALLYYLYFLFSLYSLLPALSSGYPTFLPKIFFVMSS